MKGLISKIIGFLRRIIPWGKKEEADPPPPAPSPEELKRQVEHYIKYIRVHPDDGSAQFRLGEAYVGLRLYSDALRPLKESVKLQPEHVSSHYNMGLAYVELGRDDDAISTLEFLRQKNQASPAVLNMLTRAHSNQMATFARMKRYDDAIRHFNETISITPDYGPAHLGMGIMYVQLGRYQAAIDKFKETLRMDKNLLVDSHHNLGIAYSKLKDIKKSIKHYKLAIQADPKAALIHLNLGTLYYKQKKYDEAVLYLSAALRMSPKRSKDAHFKLGHCLVLLKRWEEALEPVQEAYQISPENRVVQDIYTETLYQVSRPLHGKKEYKEEIAMLREALMGNPQHAPAHFALGTAYDKKREGKRAINHMVIARKLFLDGGDTVKVAQINKALEALFKKYNAKPEDFEKVKMPIR